VIIPWDVAARTLVVYLVVLAGVRLSGKRQLGQMTAIDLVLLLLISNAVQNAMTGPNDTLLGGLVAALTLFVAHSVISILRLRSSRFRRLVVGEPTMLIQAGRVIAKNLAREEITQDELLESLREHGVSDVKDVDRAVLEVDGTISVIPCDTRHLRGRRRAVRFIKTAK
jgi:uncharacterized membrane protein YcaP (DUF421 family)